VTPAVEEGEHGKEEEHMSPLHQEVVGVESAEEQRGHQAQHKEVESEPGDEEQLPPVAKSVTCEAVAEGGHSGEDPEACSADDHRELVRGAPGDCFRVCDGEDHEGDAGQQVADVEEEKTPEY